MRISILKAEIIYGGLLGLCSAAFLVGALSITPWNEFTLTSPGAYPALVGVLGVVCAQWVLSDCVNGRLQRKDAPEFQLANKDVLIFTGIMMAYVPAMIWLGYALSTLLFTFVGIGFLERKHWRITLLTAFVSTFIILLIFKRLFGVIMP